MTYLVVSEAFYCNSSIAIRVAVLHSPPILSILIPLFQTNFQVNFDTEIEIDGKRIALKSLTSSSLHWCGLVVDTETLEVRTLQKKILLPIASNSSLSLIFHYFTRR